MGVIPNILFWSWEPVDGETSTYLGAVDEVVKLEYMDLPTLSEAEAIHAEWKQKHHREATPDQIAAFKQAEKAADS